MLGVAASTAIVGVMTGVLTAVLFCVTFFSDDPLLPAFPPSVSVDDLRDSVRPPTPNVSLSASSGLRGSYRLKSAAALGLDVPPRIDSRATCVEAEDLGARGHEPYQLRVLVLDSLSEA